MSSGHGGEEEGSRGSDGLVGLEGGLERLVLS
jgi:hypothetical protein